MKCKDMIHTLKALMETHGNLEVEVNVAVSKDTNKGDVAIEGIAFVQDSVTDPKTIQVMNYPY